MKNKGFTLTELLAVIVILSLLMVLVLPKIVNSVNNSTDDTEELTKEIIYKAAELYASDNDLTKKNDNVYCVTLSTLTSKDYLKSPIKINDQDITNQKEVEITYEDGFSYNLVDIGECSAGYKVCTYIDNDSNGNVSLGDEVTCRSESFYVMSTDDTNKTVTMLAKYNLDVGRKYDATTSTWSSIESPLGKQSKNAIGYKSADTDCYGVISFSRKNYWYDSTTDTLNSQYGDSYPAFVYESHIVDGVEQNVIYTYVSSYKDYLTNSIELENVTATLMNNEQALALGCSDSKGTCKQSSYPWVYSTSYWTGEAVSNTTLRGIYNSNVFGSVNYVSSSYWGIRPVITISLSQIK